MEIKSAIFQIVISFYNIAKHGLAVWEIIHARPEPSLDSKKIRWLGYVYSLEIEGHTIFEKRWLVMSSRWYHFDPGDDELDGKISLRKKSQQVASRLHHIIQHHRQSAPDDNTNALAAPINPPTVTYG